ncbi:MAG: hypothetical protein IAG13_11535, partial [Deltaproteobacteria bacterium]|nr:hypothetical protein [Nannocystaceae bacterium]
MLDAPTQPSFATPAATAWAHASAFQVAIAAIAAAVPTILVALVVVACVPHVRGLAWMPELRLVVLAPACVLLAMAIALGRRSLLHSNRSPAALRTAATALVVGLS